jgi:transposase
VSRTGFRGDLGSRMLSWGEEILCCHVETEEVPRGAARAWRQAGAESGRPIAHVADDLGIHKETLRKRVRQAEADQGLRPDLPTSEEREEIKRLRQENFELRRANEILKSASVFFAKRSTQTDRGEPLRRRASWPLRGRADLHHFGRVGVRVLPTTQRSPL